MTVSIFIKSYEVDYKFLQYCLKSIVKYGTGYNEIILVVPTGKQVELLPFIPNELVTPWTTIHGVKEQGNGYIFQQYCKLIAHHYCKSDLIMFMDSDTILTKPTNLQDLIVDGKPTILHTPWKDCGDAICWKEPTEKVFDREIDSEKMRRNFLIYHRSTLEKFQEWFEKRFACTLLEYFLKTNRISEFNLLGNYAWFYQHDNYTWIDTSKEPFEPCIGEQLWSWAEKDGDELHQREYKRALDTINEALGLNLTEL